MKRKVLMFLSLLCFSLLLFGTKIDVVKADANSNGIGLPGVPASGSNSRALWASDVNTFMRVKLVYYDGHNQINIGAQKGVEYFYVINGSAFTFFGNSNFNKNGYKIFDTRDGNFNWIFLNGIINSFDFNEFERDTVGSNSYDSETQFQYFKKYLDIFGLKREDLKLESCNVHEKGHGNCYHQKGYRLIAELMAVRGDGEEVSMKDYAKECERRNRSCASFVKNGSVRNKSKLMFINWQDVNYYCPGGDCGAGLNVGCLSDDNCGWGIWIVDVSKIAQPTFDYSLDVACENCESKVSDNKAMIIQDSTNWKAIQGSKDISDDSCRNKVKGHFYKNDNVYCREEYHVYYPNAISNIKVQLGRYFYVNADQSIVDTLEDSTIPNFVPIMVRKFRTCKGDEGSLNNFKNNSDNDFKGCGGEITINYKENKNDGYELKDSKLKYKLIDFSSVVSGDTLEQRAMFSYTLKDNVFKYIRISDGFSVIGDYSNNRTYRNVGISNLPVSMSNKGSNGDIATMTFKYDLPGAPGSCSDRYSDMYNVYKNSSNGNNYLNCASTKDIDNVYKKYRQNKMEKEETIDETACVKLYGNKDLGNAGSKVSKCIDERQTNKMSDCFQKNGNNNYVCGIKENTCTKETAGKKPYEDMVWDESIKACVRKCSRVDGKYYDNSGKPVDKTVYENSCCNASNHEEMGRDLNRNNNTCCEPGTVWAENPGKCCQTIDYNPSDKTCGGKPKSCNASTAGTGNFSNKAWSDVDGKCCDKDQFENGRCCSSDNYSALGRDWNDSEGKCCPKGQTYNANTKKCEPATAEDKCKVENLNCGDKPCCKDCHGKGYCGNGSVSKHTDYCPGKPCTVKTCKDDNCDVVKEVASYRVIDPTNPFEAQSGGVARDTGENWCSDPANGTHICSGTVNGNKSSNSVVQEVILDKAQVSDSDAMYTIKLDSKAIDKIRSYNSKNDYDDFNLECTADGQKCRSNFLKNEIRSNVDTTKSKCYGVGNSSFDTCG